MKELLNKISDWFTKPYSTEMNTPNSIRGLALLSDYYNKKVYHVEVTQHTYIVHFGKERYLSNTELLNDNEIDKILNEGK